MTVSEQKTFAEAEVRKVLQERVLQERPQTAAIKIGIIGGTGFEDPDAGLDWETNPQRLPESDEVTPWGRTSSHLCAGVVAGVQVIVISRHGVGHTISPTNVNYRANVFALKKQGCTHLLSATACGILKADMSINPGDLVLLDSFIDRTTKRSTSFYDGQDFLSGVCHIPMGEPFCKKTRQIALDAAKTCDVKLQDGGTMVTIEGSRFSTRAESKFFQLIGGDLINMTTVPEAPLAAEAGLCHISIACATDFDAWRESEEAVSVAEVLSIIKGNAAKTMTLWRALIPAIAKRAGDIEGAMVGKQNAAKFSVLGQTTLTEN